MSTCLSGGSRTFGLDLDIVKSTSISTFTSSRTSSPSSTLSESSNTRKPRTPRKRPNQIYNEAAVLLSSVYPTVFPTKPFPSNVPTSLRNAPLFSSVFFHDSSSELIMPCRVSDHLGYTPPLPSYNRINAFNKVLEKKFQPLALGNCDEYFNQTSCILDEEMEPVEGIDSIMGVTASPEIQPCAGTSSIISAGLSGFPIGLGFTGLMMRRGVTALRQVDQEAWWRFPVVDMSHISPRLSSSKCNSNAAVSKMTIKKQELEPSDTSPKDIQNVTSSLMLKLNFKEVVKAWSDRGSPFDMSQPNSHTKMLEQIDLFGEGGDMREASVLRYKKKRRTRIFSKKIIRYQVCKENADSHPRMKVSNL